MRTQKVKIFKLLYKAFGCDEKAEKIKQSVNDIDDIYQKEISRILTEVHTATEDMFLCHEMAAYSRLKRLVIDNDFPRIELRSHDFDLKKLVKGDYVKCINSKAKTLTNGKKYELLETFFTYPDNKWVGRIKNDRSTKINVRPTGRFCVA